jgi:23S rRNA pseudouridine2604 synthase
MRINKFLAEAGYSTRRGADELIEKRWVTINGKIAVLGDKVQEKDEVEVRGNKKPEDYAYHAFNKPKGVTTDSISKSQEFFPVLSLDVNAEGLVLVTNDRRLVGRLTNPKYSHNKEYLVKTVNPLRPNFKEKAEEGIMKGGERISAKINIKNEKVFKMIVTDTGNHVRELCSTFFAEIESLTRIRILNIELGTLKSGDRREIVDEELAQFLKTLGL